MTTLTLARLAQEDLAALVRQIERDNVRLPEDVVQEIVARSDGMPLFLEEVTRAVLEAARADASCGKPVCRSRRNSIAQCLRHCTHR